jgi:hypothetical protein
MMDDPKIESLTSAQFRFWMRLLCLANQSVTPGVVGPLPWRGLLTRLHVGPKTFSRTSALMAAMDMLLVEVIPNEVCGEMVRITVTHFAKRQYRERPESTEEQASGNGHKKPSDEADALRLRQEKSRQNRREANGSIPGGAAQIEADVTPPVTPLLADCHAPDSRAHVHTHPTEAEAEAEADSFALQKAEAEAEADPPTPHGTASPSETASAPPCPAFSDKSEEASALPLSTANGSPPLLSKYEEQDLMRSGWTLTEIDIGLTILRERKKLPDNVKAVLVSGLLQEVRDGKRPNSIQKAMTLPYSVPGGKSAPRTYHPPEAPEADKAGVTDAASMLAFAKERIKQQETGQSRQAEGGPGG